MSCDRELADKVSPGNRVKIVGIFNVFGNSGGDSNNRKQVSGTVKVSYIRVIGI
jgi:DNA replicative helicase MCM subunit Mcm2 (Cdc46/Mcm family)